MADSTIVTDRATVASSAFDDALAVIASILEGPDHSSEALAPVVKVLEDHFGNHQGLTPASSRIWIASRDEHWRIPFGESGILSYFHSLLSSSSEPTLTLNCLRILGNSCAEKDANRQRILDHPSGLGPIIAAITDTDTRLVATVVLYNICMDYDPAQQAVIRLGAVSTVFETLSNPDFDDDLDHFLRLLEILLHHEEGKEAAPETSVATALRLLVDAEELEFNNSLSVIAVLSSLLGVARLREVTIREEGQLESLVKALERTLDIKLGEDDKKDKRLLEYARTQLMEAVGEVAMEKEFLPAFPLNGEVMQRLRNWLVLSPGEEEKTIMGCMVFGNVARSEGVCISIVEMGVHKQLHEVIDVMVTRYQEAAEAFKENQETAQEQAGTGSIAVGVIHSAVGVLKNLAIPQVNKEVLANDGGFTAVKRMLSIDGVGAGQVYYSAASLSRLLVRDTVSNIPPLLEGAPSILSLFLTLYPSIEEAPTRIEIARTIAAILRVLPSEQIPTLLQHQGVLPALWDMTVNDKFPTIRSEGWLSMALLARSHPDGKAMVTEDLTEEQLKAALQDTERGVRENAAVAGVECGFDEVVGEALKRVQEEKKESEGVFYEGDDEDMKVIESAVRKVAVEEG